MPFNYKQFRNALKHTRGIDVSKDKTYDYRAFFNDNPTEAMKIATGDPVAHFRDTYKTPVHPTFSNESKYSNSRTPGGRWIGGDNNPSVFIHSPFTARHLDETDDYLGYNLRHGSPYEISYYNGSYRLPTVEIIGKRKR